MLPWARVRELVREAGFEIFREFHRGSHSYLVAERPVAAPDPPPSALGDLTPLERGGSR